MDNSHSSDLSRKRRRISPVAGYGIGFNDESDANCEFELIHKRAHKSMTIVPEIRRRRVFPWKKLAGELRNTIYKFALISHKPIALSLSEFGKPRAQITPRSKDRGDYNIAPSLILINRGTYAEAAPLLYQNKFRFANGKTMYYFMAAISPKMKGLVERIELANERLSGWGTHMSRQRVRDTRSMVSAFPSLIGTNLKSLELAKGFDMDDWSCAYSLANFLFKNGFGHWLRSIAQEKGDPKAARDILRLREDGALRWLRRMVGHRDGISLRYMVSRYEYDGARSLAPANDKEQDEIWEDFTRFLVA